MEAIQLHDYALHLGPLEATLPPFLRDSTFSSLLVLCDSNTQVHCLPLLQPSFESYPHAVIEVPPGEMHKNIETCRFIWERMIGLGIDRQCLVINLGGGVIGDMGGFCAGTFKRGIRFIQVPTTVLSQVDASIGGKLGIDFGGVKNSIGLFENPQGVFIDTRFLLSLPERELRSGLAEIIKHSLIADASQWRSLFSLQDIGEADWNALIPPSLRIKQRIVEEDPWETGLRKSLNFGHTIGHGVEGMALKSPHPLLHGEAIAIGMICEAWLSWQWVGLPEEDLRQICSFLINLYGHRPLEESSFSRVLGLMRNDKKNTARGINFSLLPFIGACRTDCYGEESAIVEALQFYNSLAKG